MAATVKRAAGPVAAPARPSRSRLGLQVAGVVVTIAITLAALVGITLIVQPGGAVAPSPTAPSYLVDQVRPAAGIELTGADGKAFSLASMRGRAALVFFGYTHCPDVCPNTVGIVGQVIDRIGPEVGGVFVSIDPERDTVASLAEYVRFIPKGFVALTGRANEVRATADAWGVRYARVETDSPDAYSMTHTANVYLVDQQGLLRAVFQYGIQPDAMMTVVRQVLATPSATVYPPTPPPAGPASPAPPIATSLPPTAPPVTEAPSAAPTGAIATAPTTGALRAELVSSSVWAGGASPVIITLFEGQQRLADPSARVVVQLTSTGGQVSGPSVTAVAVRPPGMSEVSWVAAMDIPSSGWWRLAITVSHAGTAATSTLSVAALDPGATTRLGQPAPTVRTPTLADVGGDLRELSTDPIPDPRLYQTSTADALAAHQPFVLVIDSTKFRTSPACGQALVMARYLQDRWPSVPFIHVEPFEYTVVSETAVLLGALTNPTLVPAAAAWGIGPDPWGPTSMPWVFVVDGNGIVRAKYQGVMGSADIDVIVSLVTSGG